MKVQERYITAYSHINKMISFMGLPSELFFGILIAFLLIGAIGGAIYLIPSSILFIFIAKKVKKANSYGSPDIITTLTISYQYPRIIEDHQNIISRL